MQLEISIALKIGNDIQHTMQRRGGSPTTDPFINDSLLSLSNFIKYGVKIDGRRVYIDNNICALCYWSKVL